VFFPNHDDLLFELQNTNVCIYVRRSIAKVSAPASQHSDADKQEGNADKKRAQVDYVVDRDLTKRHTFGYITAQAPNTAL
jgi:hypothetical protein